MLGLTRDCAAVAPAHTLQLHPPLVSPFNALLNLAADGVQPLSHAVVGGQRSTQPLALLLLQCTSRVCWSMADGRHTRALPQAPATVRTFQLPSFDTWPCSAPQPLDSFFSHRPKLQALTAQLGFPVC